MKSMTTCDMTSGLLDLLSAPDGSKAFYRQMVPQTIDGSPASFGSGSPTAAPVSLADEPCHEMTQRLVEHCLSYGLTRLSIGQIMERGFRSLQLLSLMPPKTIPTKFPEMCDRQRSLLRMCIRALATYSKPEYQVVRALQLLEEKTRHSRSYIENTDTHSNLSRKEITGAVELMNSVKKVLECPVCYQIYGPPRIWQCTNGHLTCNECHEHSTTCPLCRSAFSNVRPLAIEELSRQMPVKCKNCTLGCDVVLPLLEREMHEGSCEYTPGHCPVLSCNSQFLIKDTLQHMESQHNLSVESASLRLYSGANMSFRSSITMGSNCLNSTRGGSGVHVSSSGGSSVDQQNWWWGPQFVVYENIPFFFVISRRVIEQVDAHQGYFFFWLWIGGNQVEARRFLYTLTVESVDGEKLSYTTTPVSLCQPVSMIREKQTCLLLTDSAVQRLAVSTDNNRAFKLQYRIEIIDKK